MSDLSVETTPIPGLLALRLSVHLDDRGWFEESWHREKMTRLGLPDFGPVQHNLAFSLRRGVLRGVHAEPWDKLVTVASGRVLAAWVDLREGPTFGSVHHQELRPGRAVHVPRGVGNAYQALEPSTYSYLVNQHWRADATYVGVQPFDPALGIPWPVPPAETELSEKDRRLPLLADVQAFPARRPLILGASGQVGRALARVFPEARRVEAEELDVTDPVALAAWPWHDHDLVINAAGFTDVDGAETTRGRVDAWRANAQAPATLARLSVEHGFVLTHFSSDYVFDGTSDPHHEDDPLSPLGVYGQTKAAGDLAVAGAPHHYLVRTSWVVGEGSNFVRTMVDLASRGLSPQVVHDQVGRLTFAAELARAVRHLWDSGAAFGTYNCTNAGSPQSWADIARAVFVHCGRDPLDVSPVDSEEYAAGRTLAARPKRSVLDLSRLQDSGFEAEDASVALGRYLDSATQGRDHP